jgi:transcriptional regulator with GAF, ATPase, and Fis domain
MNPKSAASPGDDACDDRPLELLGESPAIRRLRQEIASVAATRSTVLLLGETGTGKSLVARIIHRLSRQADGPFVHADCASFAPTMIESELFGHERGAFTGAIARRIGRVEQAHGGTLFLDEIGNAELYLQAKLLRVVQERRFERVGGTQTLVTNARLIAATHSDLEGAVARGEFRADLYYRLRVFELVLPPLRERLCDIPILARAGLRELGQRLQLGTPEIPARFDALLMAYPWPGNVRELFNLIERLMVSGRGEKLDVMELEALLGRVPVEHGTVARDEGAARSEIAAVLLATGGNVSRAARRLGLSRSTLRYRLRRLGLCELIPND